MGPDFEAAKQYALGRLAQELPPVLGYHSLEHTRDEVVPAAERLALLEGVTDSPLLLLRTAAYFHDIGFVERYFDNEVVAVRIASENLPRFGYTPEHVETIAGIIMVTRLPQTPHNHLEEIMADADLDGLGRDDFIQRERALRGEWALVGRHYTEAEWYHEQVSFLQSHRYFTQSARRMRDPGKQRNMDCCLQILARLS